jgi:hypothetical protein
MSLPYMYVNAHSGGRRDHYSGALACMVRIFSKKEFAFRLGSVSVLIVGKDIANGTYGTGLWP